MHNSSFNQVDYILFLLSLCIPLSISLYIGCFKKTHKTTANEYLYGKRKLNAWTIGLSLYAGTVSSLDIVGTASEVYIFGTQYIVICLGSLTSMFIMWYCILPVFCSNLNLKTPFEYFEQRFDRKIRMMMSTLLLIHSLLYMPILLYISTISFSQVTEISLPLCTTVVGVICTVYTLIGGFVGVIWTDVIQASLMLLSCTFVMIKGLNNSGGFSKTLEIAEGGQRLQFFNFDPNPFTRMTFWSAFLGQAAFQTAFGGCSAKALQRFMAVNTEKSARISTAISTIGFSIQIILSGITGLCIYAMYSNCDPVSNKEITSASEILSYFINDIAGYIPGFVGFFVAGLISAGLSSISADMNVISGSIYYDLLQKIFNTNNWKLKDTAVMKLIIIIYGVLLMILAPILGKHKYINQMATSVSSIPYGSIAAVTLLGTSFPKINSKGTFCGILTSLVLIGWISIYSLSQDFASEYTLPVSTENCSNIHSNFTDFITASSTTIINKSAEFKPEPFILFKLSFTYYPFVGIIITMLVALVVSYFTGMNDINKMNSNLIIPRLRPQIMTSTADVELSTYEKN